MKRIVFALLFIVGLSVNPLFAQGVHIYDPQANATEQIAQAVKRHMRKGKMSFFRLVGTGVPGA